jgi:hypothetical protein
VVEYATLTKPTASDRADFESIVSTIDLTASDATGTAGPVQFG